MVKNVNLQCQSPKKVFCDIEISLRYPSGICVNCGRVLADINTIQKEINDLVRLYPDNIELFVDIADTIKRNNFKLTDTEIRTICNDWFKLGGKQTRKRLDLADELFLTLHRANETLERPINRENKQSDKVDLIYLSEESK